MKILAIDTSTMVSSVALVDQEKIYSEITINAKKNNHSERLMLLIDEVLKSSDIRIQDVDLFSCSIGPGSFTGLRIAISTIKGLAQSLQKPVIGASTLQSLAYNMPLAEGILCPVMDAQRDEVYTCFYKWRQGELIALTEESVLSVDQLLKDIEKQEENVILLGDALKKFTPEVLERYQDKIQIAPMMSRMPKASSLGNLALDMAKKGAISTYADIEPNYMRKSQAEVQLEEKHKKKLLDARS